MADHPGHQKGIGCPYCELIGHFAATVRVSLENAVPGLQHEGVLMTEKLTQLDICRGALYGAMLYAQTHGLANAAFTAAAGTIQHILDEESADFAAAEKTRAKNRLS